AREATPMGKNRARSKEDDPMVPVHSPHLRAAMADRGLRVADVARRLKDRRQTVAYLAGGEGIKRSRGSRRARLAKLLGVSEQWLAEPTAVFIPLYLPEGVQHLVFGTGFPLESPRAQLAWERILEPWFTKEAKLNYRRLREKAGFPTPPDERRSDTNPYTIVPPGREGGPKS